jgi:hypothetical protein
LKKFMLALALFTSVAVVVPAVETDRAEAAVSCWERSRGKGIKNGFGTLVGKFVGHLRWCGNGTHVTSGSFWVTVYRCCHWYYEGIVAQRNGPGCFRSPCHMVERYRMGSFAFHPPYPSTTSRWQPWVMLRGYANGKFESAAGD